MLATVLAPVAAYAKHHHHFARVEVMRNTMGTMKDGTKIHVQVIKMNGQMMAVIPMHDLPDWLTLDAGEN
jgi:hypothetical protein